MEDLYARLGMPPFSDATTIKRAFRSSAKRHHPDVGGSRETYDLCRNAFEILINATSREDYDQRFRQELATQKQNTEDIRQKLTIVLAWSARHPKFDSSYAVSLANTLSGGGFLTLKQIEGLDNIISSFKIDLEKWQKNPEKLGAALDEFFTRQTILRAQMQKGKVEWCGDCDFCPDF